MIVFKAARWKNFLSTGDNTTEIDLDQNPTTLIVGPNGSGKSTLLDALSFALFGKPHRDINKPQLVNTINNRDCEVEVEFSIGGTDYVVRRGIKPNIFEIYQNGKLLNQESHSRDYQKVLEQNILKLNHKSFHQIVVLGSSSFVPFMQLPSQHRREVIEDLLDINIFTKMNGLLKEKSVRLREQLAHTNHEIEIVKEKIGMQKKHIAELKAKEEAHSQKNQEKIDALQKQIQDLEDASNLLQDGLAEAHKAATSRMDKVDDKNQTLNTYDIQIEKNIKAVVKEAKFYEDHDQCPTCAQPIDSTFKSERVHICTSKAKELKDGKQKLVVELEKVLQEKKEVAAILKECNNKNSQLSANRLTVNHLLSQIATLRKETSSKNTGDIDSAEKSLEDMHAQMETLDTTRSEFYEEGTYNQVISEMLKDTGIKTKVIQQYLPVMNRLINQYLQILDFFVSFNLDESFEEVIRSRHRDEFSYASFSEGEKQRIDLALLFTWRQVARMKNSVSTNLLILDETFDSSMDADGVENLIKILSTLEDNTNVFIISHKTDALDGKFANRIEFCKENNFSSIKQKLS